jgi:hypothetical protein
MNKSRRLFVCLVPYFSGIHVLLLYGYITPFYTMLAHAVPPFFTRVHSTYPGIGICLHLYPGTDTYSVIHVPDLMVPAQPESKSSSPDLMIERIRSDIKPGLKYQCHLI